MQHKTVFELFKKSPLLIYASQFMKPYIIPLSFILLNLEIGGTKGKNYKKIEYLEQKELFT